MLETEIPGRDWDAFTGVSRPTSNRVAVGATELIVLSGVDISDLIVGLPLAGHIGSTEHELVLARTKSAVSLLAELDQDCANHIATWMTALVWLSYDVSANYSQLTSSSFPILPHCAFVTNKANRHIPPDTVVDRDSIYFLAENLYHEALHLELSATLLLTDVVSDSYESSETRRIQIPWRGQSWEPDRVVHAAYVYANILRLRIKALRAGVIEPELGKSAIETGLGALKYLSSKLENCSDMFTDHGRDLLIEIKRQSQQAAHSG